MIETIPGHQSPLTRSPEVLSFRAVIVMTKHAGGSPTLEDVRAALEKAGMQFVIPATAEGVTVIALNDLA